MAMGPGPWRLHQKSEVPATPRPKASPDAQPPGDRARTPYKMVYLPGVLALSGMLRASDGVVAVTTSRVRSLEDTPAASVEEVVHAGMEKFASAPVPRISLYVVAATSPSLFGHEAAALDSLRARHPSLRPPSGRTDRVRWQRLEA